MTIPKMIGLGVAGVSGVFGLMLAFGSFKIVDPGNRGVRVTLGRVDPQYIGEGLTVKMPFVTSIVEMSVRQWTFRLDAACYSSDLQQVNCQLKVLYHAPENQVVTIYQQYQTDVFETLVAPRVQEALKEATAGSTAEQIVKKRETLKQAALIAAQKKIGALVVLDDLVIENIDLTKELEAAIESKMVQEQEASKSKFVQDKSRIEAETQIIKAKAEAEAISIQGEALKKTPDLIQLKIVEKWDGRTPLVVGATTQPTGIMLPIADRR